MPLLGFKKKFAPEVEARKKRQTIRARRKYPVKLGDRLYLYVGLRTPSCRKLGEATCQRVRHIRIEEGWEAGCCRIVIDGQLISLHELEVLAHSDGFECGHAFEEFFRKEHGLPFEGQIINW